MRSSLKALSLPMLAALGLGASPVSIPAGSFEQGGGMAPDANPPRQVSLSAYRLDPHEVSIAAFEDFVAQAWHDDAHWSPEGARWRAAHPRGAGPSVRASGRPSDHPVVAVSWYEAQAYCAWKGGRLPSEAEWERAACGPDGAPFAWGPEPVPGPVWFVKDERDLLTTVHTQPVASQDPALASPFGLLHSAGNVWEWTADSYAASAYRAGPATDPVNRDERPWRVLRGGSYMNLPSYCQCRHREPAEPAEPRLTVGFRCAYAP
jgi:sulfatase modifying factor 1